MDTTSVRLRRAMWIVLAAVALGSALAVHAAYPGHDGAVLLGLVLQLAATAAVGRTRPAAVGVVGVGLAVALLTGVPSVWQDAGSAGLVFWAAPAIWVATADLLGRGGPHRAIAPAVVGWSAYVVALASTQPGATGALAALAPVLGGAATAGAVRLRQARRERSDARAAHERLRAEHARSEDRAGLAEAMHDLVSHRLTHLVILARTLAASTADAGARDRAGVIEETALDTLTALRDTLRDLTGASTSTSAEPRRTTVAAGLDEIGALVAEARGLGERVDLTVEPTEASGAVSTPTYEAVSRVVQEGLVNARKHAPGAAVRVAVSLGPVSTVAVCNAPPSRRPDPALADTGSGTGLRGLRRRVALLGGDLSAGRSDDGGYILGARFDDATSS